MPNLILHWHRLTLLKITKFVVIDVVIDLNSPGTDIVEYLTNMKKDRHAISSVLPLSSSQG